MKQQSVISKHKQYLNQLRTNNPTAQNINSLIHRAVVTKHCSERTWINPLLGTKPPEIDSSETTLDRSDRVKLSRLRSGYSTLVGATRSRYDKTVSPNCPKCRNVPDTVSHYLQCKPTHPIDPQQLWHQPVQSADRLH